MIELSFLLQQTVAALLKEKITPLSKACIIIRQQIK